MQAPALKDERGGFAIEVMVALMILGTVLLGATAAQVGARRIVAGGQEDTATWAAVHAQVEWLEAQPYSSLTSGAGTIHGVPMQWIVSGSEPRQILLVVQRPQSNPPVQDTIGIYRWDPDAPGP